MMRALSVGSVSAATVCTVCSAMIQSRTLRYGPRWVRSSRISTAILPRRRRSRNSFTISGGDIGSPTNIGCVRGASLSVIGTPCFGLESRPDARDETPDVDDSLLQDLDRRRDAILEGQAQIDRRERALERRGVQRRVDDRGDHRVLVGEDPEDGAFGDAGGVAIWRVVTISPFSSSNGSVACTIIDAPLVRGILAGFFVGSGRNSRQ